MTAKEIAAFLGACATPAEEVLGRFTGPDLHAPKPVPVPTPPPPKPPSRRGEHLRGERRPRRTAVGRGVCHFCREVEIVHEVHGLLCCSWCPGHE